MSTPLAAAKAMELRDHRMAVAEQRRQERAVTRKWMMLGFTNLLVMTGGIAVLTLLA